MTSKKLSLLNGSLRLFMPTIYGFLKGLDTGANLINKYNHSKLNKASMVICTAVGTSIGGAVNIVGLPVLAPMGVYVYYKTYKE